VAYAQLNRVQGQSPLIYFGIEIIDQAHVQEVKGDIQVDRTKNGTRQKDITRNHALGQVRTRACRPPLGRLFDRGQHGQDQMERTYALGTMRLPIHGPEFKIANRGCLHQGIHGKETRTRLVGCTP
jgi:hypothetical protein